eukprot:GFYU01005273.1.p1 GENE.GFYU01005273.1~~GFYU01005273.1.p1  ORF type:complete len:456 (-),score=111.90 GFYU01005273.1:753-2120(-)
MAKYALVDEVRLREVFNTLDQDGDGFIDANELRIGLQKLAIPCNPKIVEEMVYRMDKNQDGKIDFEEFKNFAVKRESELFIVFQSLDATGDSVLSGREIRQGLTQLGYSVSNEDVRKLMYLMDKDKSNNVDFDEFRNFLLLLPAINPKAIFEYWMKSTALDIGEDATIPDDHNSNPRMTLLAGGFAGAVSRTATAPMDRLKVILQAQTTANSPSISQGLRNIYAEGGWRAFYRGNGANIVKIAPESAIKFWAYENAKKFFAKDPENMLMTERLMAGATAGIASQSCIYPLEVVKTRLALAPRGTYRGIGDCMMKMVRSEGMMSLSKGMAPSLMGVIPYAGVDLAVYGKLKDLYSESHQNENPPIYVVLGCGAVSSTCGQIVAYPLQLVRTRLQAQGLVKGGPQYTGMVDCFQKTVQENGVRGLYRGILPNFLKALPAISISYAVFEQAKTFLNVA